MDEQAPARPAEDSRSDEELLRAFVAGKRDGGAALGELARRHERELLGLACGMLDGDRDGAMEAVQDAWVRVIRYGAGFRAGSSVRTWLYRVVINRCVDMRRARARDALPLNGSVEASQGPTLADTSGLRRAMRVLSDDQRLILLLCHHRGLTNEQAAEVLGIPVGTLKSRQHAAITELRAVLRQGGEP